jgi:proton-dependent oligopeptide transporter, POT family
MPSFQPGFYLAINLGSCGAISASFLARDNGYWAAFLVPTCIFALVPLVMAIGKKYYVVTPPRGSVFLETLRVWGICMAPHWSLNVVGMVKSAKQPGFWDAAKPSHYKDGNKPAVITWDDEFVGEVERSLKACAVFLFFPFYWLCKSVNSPHENVYN